ncbi:hypothetical protein NQ318_021960 [Aromia moschata]|uniref:Uncharacterized protein n=1 Tax=Aromia moschata TaxID=1265417 RepID=A0AAV8XTY0_9CUCU|nr:hypothetical protein NQ318_021960 [Aromia moschata]
MKRYGEAIKATITLCALVAVAYAAVQPQTQPFKFQNRRYNPQNAASALSGFPARTYSPRPAAPTTSHPSRYASYSGNSQYNSDNSGAYRPQFAGSARASDEGQYTPDNSGSYSPSQDQYSSTNSAYNSRTGYPYRYASSNEGRYDADNSGAYYQSDNSGSYYHDNTGIYIHDNSGDYFHIHNPYEHQEEKYVHKGGEYIHPKNYVSIPPAGGYGAPVNLQRGNAAGLYDNRNYKIIRKIEHVGDDLYDYLYETENGIYAEEDGKIGNKGKKEEAIRAKGYFTYTGPDSIIYTVNYTADENGFLPDADHIPTPPPVPEHIERSLAYQRSIGELE